MPTISFPFTFCYLFLHFSCLFDTYLALLFYSFLTVIVSWAGTGHPGKGWTLTVSRACTGHPGKGWTLCDRRPRGRGGKTNKARSGLFWLGGVGVGVGGCLSFLKPLSLSAFYVKHIGFSW